MPRHSAPAPVSERYIELNRRFLDQKDEEIGEEIDRSYISSWFRDRAPRWDELLESERVVLFAEAGSGKTWEMQAQVGRLSQGGKAAFFVPLEALARLGLRDYLAMAPEAVGRFDSWLSDPGETAWLFLDAVDELKLTEGTLDIALGAVARDVGNARSRLRVILSCRPTDWRPVEDKDTFLRRLPLSDPIADSVSDKEAAEEDEFLAPIRARHEKKQEAATSSKTAPQFRMVVLLPLDSARILQFATALKVRDPQALLDEIRQQEAMPFARRPLDLERLIRSWQERGNLGTRLQQHQDDVRESLHDKAGRRDASQLSADEALEGAEWLALGLVMTRCRAITEPGSLGSPRQDGTLAPASILGSWPEAKIAALLRRAMFDPGTYGRVRFHHRSIQEYLAAERLRKLRGAGMTARQLHRLLFADTYGEKVVVPALRPIAAWLSIHDPAVAHELLRREPEVLLQFGDPESLSIDVRRELLKAFVEAYAGGGWRGLHMPRAESRRLAKPELAAEVRAAWEQTGTNEEVQVFLLELVALGRFADCADLALSTALNPAFEANTRAYAIEALAALQRTHMLRQIADAMLSNPEDWPDRLVADDIASFFPGVISVDELMQLVRRTRQGRSYTTGFAWSLFNLADGCDPHNEEIRHLRKTLADELWKAVRLHDPHRRRSGMGHLAPALTRISLQEAEAGLFTEELAWAGVITHRFHGDTLGREELGQLSTLLRGRRELRPVIARTELEISKVVAPAKDGSGRHFNAFVHDTLVRLEGEDWDWLLAAFRETSDPGDQEVYLHALLDVWRGRGREASERDTLAKLAEHSPEFEELVGRVTDMKPYEPSTDMRRLEKTRRERQRKEAARQQKNEKEWAAWRDGALADPDAAFAPKNKIDGVLALMNWLAHDRSGSNLAQPNWLRVRQVLGDSIADRFEAGLRAYWRATPIETRTERGESNTIYHYQGIGLTGLAAEAAIGPNWARALTPEHAALALRWSTLELNGLPEWADALAAAWPAEAAAFYIAEMRAELGSAGATFHPHVLSAISYGSDTIKQLVAPAMAELLQSWPPVPKEADKEVHYSENLSRALAVISASGVSSPELVRLCVSRFEEAGDHSSGVAWLRGAFSFDFGEGLAALERAVSKMTADGRKGIAANWFAALFGDRHTRTPVDLSNSSTAQLAQLVRLAYQSVRREDDITHEGTFSPGPRDNAQDARNRLIGALIERSGREAHDVLLRLADDPLFAHMPDRLRLLARERAAKDSEPAALTPSDFAEWQRLFEAAPRNRDELRQVMWDVLDDIQHEIAHHDFTSRGTLAKIDSEIEMQPILAKMVEDRARGRYQVTREEEVVDRKETDIRLVATAFPGKAVIELKLGDKWSVNDLERAITDQLVAQYLRHEGCSVGCLLVTYAGRTGFKDPATRRAIPIETVLDRLQSLAEGAEAAESGRVRIFVRLLDLRSPLSHSKGRKQATGKPLRE